MNPVSHARYLSSYSTTALSKHLGVSRQYINRLEQGLYDKPNQKLLEWVATTLNKSLDDTKQINASIVEQLYREWQWQRRESCKDNKSLRSLEITEYDRVRQPDIMYYHRVFRQWRMDNWISPHAFCVDMCLHPSPVVDYEEGNTQSMPSNLKKVLIQLDLLGKEFKTSER